jgi:hypothetical protein
MRFAFALLLLGACAAGQKTSPAGRVAALEYFVGSWSADLVNPQTNKSAHLAYRIEPVLDGAFYLGTGDSPELGVRINDYWGVDSVTNEIVRSMFDNHGVFGVVRSKGWDGNTLVFEGGGTGGGDRFRVRETITRVGPDEFHAVWEQETPNGWQAYSNERLVRQR